MIFKKKIQKFPISYSFLHKTKLNFKQKISKFEYLTFILNTILIIPSQRGYETFILICMKYSKLFQKIKISKDFLFHSGFMF